MSDLSVYCSVCDCVESTESKDVMSCRQRCRMDAFVCFFIDNIVLLKDGRGVK